MGFIRVVQACGYNSSGCNWGFPIVFWWSFGLWLVFAPIRATDRSTIAPEVPQTTPKRPPEIFNYSHVYYSHIRGSLKGVYVGLSVRDTLGMKRASTGLPSLGPGSVVSVVFVGCLRFPVVLLWFSAAIRVCIPPSPPALGEEPGEGEGPDSENESYRTFGTRDLCYVFGAVHATNIY